MKLIYKRGNSYYYDFVVKGQRHQGSLGKITKTAAREAAAKRRIAVLEGKLLKRPAKAPLLSEIAKEYITYYEQNRKPKSATRIKCALAALTSILGTKRLDEIDPWMLETYKQRRKALRKADATVNRELACLKNLYNKAESWGLVTENPVKRVQLFKENNARQRFLTEEEEQNLLKHCSFRLAALIIAASDTGFRASELSSLSWRDVDFVAGTVTVHSCYTKNGETRTSPMTPRLTQMLTLLKGDGTVSSETPIFGSYCYRKAFGTACRKAGLGKDVVFHTLRHTFISRLMMKGADIRTVQELAGHKEIKMTMRYAHLSPEHKRKAIALLGGEVPAIFTTVDDEVDVSVCAPVAQMDRASVS